MSSAATLLDDNIFDEDDGLREPNINTELYGHKTIEAQLLKDINANRLPHAIILSGVAAIGKATLAFRLARYLLAGGVEKDSLFIDQTNPVAKRIASYGHADLKYITPSYEDEDGKKKATRIIRVDRARKIPQFLSQTSAEGGWRIVIIDEAELMTNQAQNAILKTLEEPPEKTILILITSEQGKLLSTIHSRCRMLPMKNLSDEIMKKLLDKSGIDNKHHDELIKISNGRIGYAIALFENGGVEVYQQVLDALRGMSGIEKRKFADKLGTKKQEIKYQLFMELLLDFLVKASKDTAMNNNILEPEILKLHSKHQWFDMWQKIHDWYIKSEQRYLDKKAVALHILTILEGKK